MSEFSDSLVSAWTTSVRVFGETILFGVSPTAYDCVIHDLAYSTEVEGNRAGRSAVLSGSVIMKASDWTAANGQKGIVCTVGGASARVLNDPAIGFGSDTVTLVLGPRT